MHNSVSKRIISILLIPCKIGTGNTRAKRLRMRKVSIFKLAVVNANFTIRMPGFELKSNFTSIQNFKAGNVKPPGMHWSKDFKKAAHLDKFVHRRSQCLCSISE